MQNVSRLHCLAVEISAIEFDASHWTADVAGAGARKHFDGSVDVGLGHVEKLNSENIAVNDISFNLYVTKRGTFLCADDPPMAYRK